MLISDEFECMSRVNNSYGTWFINVSDQLVSDLLKQAMDKCSQVENSFIYCIFCMGSQCRLQPSESMVNYVRSCLEKLNVESKVKDSIINMLNRALAKSTDIVCVGE